MKFDMCRAKLKGKRGVYYQSDVCKSLSVLYSLQNFTDSQCSSFNHGVM